MSHTTSMLCLTAQIGPLAQPALQYLRLLCGQEPPRNETFLFAKVHERTGYEKGLPAPEDLQEGL